MPRDASGNYTLPAGNPVVDGTIIETSWANPTMSDIALQLNNVITRDGLLGPTAPLKFTDGTTALPGMAFNSDPNTGIYLVAPDVLGFTVGGTTVLTLSGTDATFANIPKFAPAPLTNDTLANKLYVDTVAGGFGGPYLPLAGGTLTGALTVNLTNALVTLTDGAGSYAVQTTAGAFRLYDFSAAAARLTFVAGVNGLASFSGPIAATGDVYGTAGLYAGIPATALGHAIVSRGDGTRTGYIQFVAANDVRQGYIGFSTSLASADAGTINFIMGTATFNGAIVAAGDITAFSDDTVKANWKDMDQWFVEELAGVKAGIYDRTDMDLRQVGVSAQSLRHVMPEAVREAQDGSLSVNYGHAALVACVALAREVVQLKARLA